MGKIPGRPKKIVQKDGVFTPRMNKNSKCKGQKISPPPPKKTMCFPATWLRPFYALNWDFLGEGNNSLRQKLP